MKTDNKHFYTRAHLIIDDDDELKPEIEDIGKEQIRIAYSEGMHTIVLTLGEKKALELCHLITTYFQDKNTNTGG